MEISIREKLLSGGMWVLGGKLFSFISNIAVSALLARLLTPDSMGLYFLVFSLVHFAMMFSLLGMERSIVRTVAESLALDQPERAVTAVRYVLQFGLISSAIVGILLLTGFGRLISEHVFNSTLMNDMLYFPAIWMVLLTFETLIVESFRGYHDIRFATVYNGMITYTISAAALGYLYWTSGNSELATVLIVIIAAHAANLLVAVLSLAGTTGMFRFRKTDLISRGHVLRTSWGLYFTNMALFFMTSGQLWILAYASTKQSVAVYGAVSRFMVLLTTTLSMVKLVVLPMIGHLYTKKNWEKLEKVLRSSATIAGLPAIGGLLVIIGFGRDILYYVYGEYYTAGYIALLVLAAANLINVFTGVPGALMVMAGKEKILLAYTVISGSIGLTISLLLVGPMDYEGVAIGGGFGIVLYNLLMVWYCKRRLSVNTLMSVREFCNLLSSIRYVYGQFASGGGLRRHFRKPAPRPKT